MSSSKAKKSSRTEAQAATPEAPRWPEIVIGILDGFDADGRPLVDYPGNAAGAPLPALTTALYGAEAVVLECGHASITLTSAGKVLIRGAYLSSRSSGVHRIKGASVDIN